MTALRAKDCGFHTSYTAADNGDLLLLLYRRDIIFFRLHRFGIERATRKSHRIGKVLRVCVSLGGREIKATAMTADTRLDVIKSVLDKLRHPFGVYKELTRNTNGVYSAIGNGFCSDLHIHSSRADHGNINEFFDMRNVLKVAVFGHIHRRMRPIPRVVRTVVGIEHIVARILKILGCSFGFLHITSDLNVILTGHCALAKSLHLGLYRVTERYGIILAARLLDRFYDLCGKAISVFKAAAVFVGTLIEKFDRKLVEKVALVNRVDLNTVNTRFLAKPCGLGKRLDDLVDLLDRHLGAFDIVRPTGGLRGRRCKLVRGVDYRLNNGSRKFVLVQRRDKLGDRPRASHTRRKLNKELSAGLVDLVHKDLQILEHLFVLPKPFAPKGVAQGGNSGDNKSNVVVCSLKEELCRLLVKATARKLKPTEERRTAHRAHYDSVFDLHVADLPRCK